MAAMGAMAATGAMATLPVAQAMGAIATVLLLVLGVVVAATTAILPLQEQATLARTVAKAASSQAAMVKMVVTAVLLAVSLLMCTLLGCASDCVQPASIVSWPCCRDLLMGSVFCCNLGDHALSSV